MHVFKMCLDRSSRLQQGAHASVLGSLLWLWGGVLHGHGSRPPSPTPSLHFTSGPHLTSCHFPSLDLIHGGYAHTLGRERRWRVLEEDGGGRDELGASAGHLEPSARVFVEHVDHLSRTKSRRHHGWRLAVVQRPILGVDVGSEEHEGASDRWLLTGRRHVQRRLAVPIGHVERGAGDDCKPQRRAVSRSVSQLTLPTHREASARGTLCRCMLM